MSQFALRNYQIEALDVIDSELKRKKSVLFVAIMGAGKTVTACRLVNSYYKSTDKKFLVLVNKQELIDQFLQTFVKKTDIPPHMIGVCCAGLNSRDISNRVTIATVQTFCGMIEDYRGADLCILDECHAVGMDGGQYQTVIDALRKKKSSMRILGITATPFRLGHGMIYGKACVDPEKNLFDDVAHKITYERLLNEGHLVKLRGKVAHAESLGNDLSEVSVSGDYVLNQLGEIMTREIHLATARDAIKEFCGGFHRVCVFCCTIEHAERLRAIINEIEPCVTIHSNLTPLERAGNMRSWKDGDARICTSVNILAEGFDYPPLDCLVFARPTLSARLYLQAVGRVLRTSPETGKVDGFLLDLTCNTARFGTDIDRVKVDIPKRVIDAAEKKEDSLWKFCPQCSEECHKSLRQCEACGFEWPVAEIVEASSVPDMRDVNFERQPPVSVVPTDMVCSVHVSKNGKCLGKVSFVCDDYRFLSVWFCMDDFYGGFAVNAGSAKWRDMGGQSPYPATCEEFTERAERELVLPLSLDVDISGKYPEVVGIHLEPRVMTDEEYDELYGIVPF